MHEDVSFVVSLIIDSLRNKLANPLAIRASIAYTHS